MTNNQDALTENGHTSVSNIPEETSEVAVPEGQEVYEEPYEGEGFQDSQAGSLQDMEVVPGYANRRAPLDQILADPNITLAAPDTSGLRDIAEASYASLAPTRNPVVDPVVEEVPLAAFSRPEVIIGGFDDRAQITNTTDYPWRVHASLLITAADNNLYMGTGWFIGPHALVTAGHCVFIHDPGTPHHGWVRSIKVMPGRNGNTLPFGSVTSTDFRTVSEWMQSGDENYDYGAIRIPTELGNTVGWFGFGVYADNDLLASTANISGYPGDKPDGTQWYHARQVASVNSKKVYYATDTMPGQSGSAVYRIINGGHYGIAVHAYGGATANSGTRIIRPVYDNLVAWKA
jgi:glutamyl endopeptidase